MCLIVSVLLNHSAVLSQGFSVLQRPIVLRATCRTRIGQDLLPDARDPP